MLQAIVFPHIQQTSRHLEVAGNYLRGISDGAKAIVAQCCATELITLLHQSCALQAKSLFNMLVNVYNVSIFSADTQGVSIMDEIETAMKSRSQLQTFEFVLDRIGEEDREWAQIVRQVLIEKVAQGAIVGAFSSLLGYFKTKLSDYNCQVRRSIVCCKLGVEP